MEKNKNQNTVWLVILAVVLLFIWLNASPESSQVGAQESEQGLESDEEFGGEFGIWSGGGGFERGGSGDSGNESSLPKFGRGDLEGGGRVGMFKPGSKLDNFLCNKKKPSGGGGHCGSHSDDGHLHIMAHKCP